MAEGPSAIGTMGESNTSPEKRSREGRKRKPKGPRPGATKGRAKPAGSGRKPKDWKSLAKESIWEYVIRGLNGDPVQQSGPTGKQISRPLTQDNQVRLLTTAWKKLEPDLSAHAVQQQVEDVTQKLESKDIPPRDLARSVLSILQTAEVKETPKPPAQEQLLIGRDVIIENPSPPTIGTRQTGWQDIEGKGEASDLLSASSCSESEERSSDSEAARGGSPGNTDNPPSGSDALAPPSLPPSPSLNWRDGDIVFRCESGAHVKWNKPARTLDVYTWEGHLLQGYDNMQEAMQLALAQPGPLRPDDRLSVRHEPRVLRRRPR